MSNILTLCIILIALGCILPDSSALRPLPDAIRAETEVYYYYQDDAEMFAVEEVTRRSEGSTRLRVINVTDPDKKKSKTLEYYRINEHLVHYDKLESRILAFDPVMDQCNNDFTSTWLLARMTQVLKTLMSSDGISLGTIETDRTSIGPIAFVRLLNENKHLFKLDSKGFDEIRLANVFYFSADFELDNRMKLVRFVTLIPTSRINNLNALEMGRTMLSQVDTDSHAIQIGLVLLDKVNDKSALTKKASVLLDYFGSEYETLQISYNSIQELSLSRHLGTSTDESADDDPFSLPAGSRCGSVSNHLPFFADAKQFSGLLYAKHIDRETYIAYDTITNHMRIDSVGQHKIIYDLERNRATMVVDSSMINNSGKLGVEYQLDTGTESTVPKRNYRADRNHCSEISLNEIRTNNGLANCYTKVKSLVEVLGIGPTALLYLGIDTLEDGLKVHKFEREVSLNELPILVSLNLRIYPPSSGRLSLVYYFASEIPIASSENFSIFEVDAYKTMWLRRIVLLSSNDLSKYKTILSEINFIHSSWNLELKPDQDVGRESTALNDAVHTFDVGLDCESQSKRLKLEYVLGTRSDGEVLFNYINQPPVKTSRDSEFNPKIEDSRSIYESLEEGIISFTSRRLGVSRGQINRLQVLKPPNLQNQHNSLLVSAVVSSQLTYETSYNPVGWVEDFSSLGDNAQLIVKRASMPLNECILTIATMFREETAVQSVHCPYLGCGYITSNDKSLRDVLKRLATNEEEPSITLHHDMCTVYKQEKSVTSSLLGKERSSKTMSKALADSLVYIDLGSIVVQDPQSPAVRSSNQTSTKQVIFRAKVKKVAISDVVLHESFGEQLAKGSCYSTRTVPIDQNSSDGKPQATGIAPIKTIELQFDSHHSIYHCHKACQFYSPCQTYSYSPQKQICALSNLSKSFNRAQAQVDPEMIDVKPLMNLYLDDPRCVIYAINSAALYTQAQQVLSTTPGVLATRRHFVTIGSLNECADLCHSYELVESQSLKYKCTKFQHSLMESVCAIYDSDSYLFEQLKSHLSRRTQETLSSSFEYSKGLMSIDDWAKISHFGTYSRDFASLYNVEYSVEVSVEETSENIDQKASMAIIYDLDYEGCLRECSAIHLDCVMVDFCFNPVKHVPVKRCKIYKIRSPYALHAHSNPIKLGKAVHISSEELRDHEAKLTDLEERFYLKEKRSSSYNISIREGSCVHNYISGDNLFLKREIWQSLLTKDKRTPMIEEAKLASDEKDKDHEEASLRLSKELDSIALMLDRKLNSYHSSILWATTLQVLFGLGLGLLLFTYGGDLPRHVNEVYKTYNLRTSVGLVIERMSQSLRGRATRSDSQVEFREMDQINQAYANNANNATILVNTP